jgi:hypothetical protein
VLNANLCGVGPVYVETERFSSWKRG